MLYISHLNILTNTPTLRHCAYRLGAGFTKEANFGVYLITTNIPDMLMPPLPVNMDNMLNERKKQKFWEMQQFLKKKFKGAHTKTSQSGKYFVADSNEKNLIGENYPDLALADDVYTAWKNAFTVEHWDRMEARQVKGIRKDIQNNTIQGGEGMTKAIYEYFEEDIEMYDEENVNE